MSTERWELPGGVSQDRSPTGNTHTHTHTHTPGLIKGDTSPVITDIQIRSMCFWMWADIWYQADLSHWPEIWHSVTDLRSDVQSLTWDLTFSHWPEIWRSVTDLRSVSWECVWTTNSFSFFSFIISPFINPPLSLCCLLTFIPRHLHPTRLQHSGPSLLGGGGPGGGQRWGLWHGGHVALHGSASDYQPLPSGPARRLRPLLSVRHVGAVCHLHTPGPACLSPTWAQNFRHGTYKDETNVSTDIW